MCLPTPTHHSEDLCLELVLWAIMEIRAQLSSLDYKVLALLVLFCEFLDLSCDVGDALIEASPIVRKALNEVGDARAIGRRFAERGSKAGLAAGRPVLDAPQSRVRAEKHESGISGAEDGEGRCQDRVSIAALDDLPCGSAATVVWRATSTATLEPSPPSSSSP